MDRPASSASTDGSAARGRPLGILAGGGSLPREVAEAVRASGRDVRIVALDTDATAFAPFPVTAVRWGEIGGLLAAFEAGGVKDLVILGSVTRPDLGRLKVDRGFFAALPQILAIIAAGGDDSVLRRVVRFFEGRGFHVVAPGDVAPGLLVGEGFLGHESASPAALRDVRVGFDIVARLAPFDIGQAVIVRDGEVATIEAAEGTDRMMERAVSVLPAAARGTTRAGVLVKRPKPGQERRVDLPAIGPMTVARAEKLGLAGIAVEAGGTLVAERPRLVGAADASHLFVLGLAPEHKTVGPGSRGAVTDRASTRDGEIAAAVLQALGPAVRSEAVIVARRQVLAIETGEGVEAAIERAASHRPWGLRSLLGRRGVALVSAGSARRPSVAAAAAAGGFKLVAYSHGKDESR